ncbi:MAG: 6-bladed beta-propeller [Gemmatimonadetes bacterium]|nr:6-bladed beta-propeller [Gemmatimonadota bacterium]
MRILTSRPFRTGAAALLLSIAVAVAGCGGDAGAPSGWAGTIDTLANGAVLVSNPETGLWREGEEWRLVEEMRIGSMDVEGPELFGSIAGLVADERGRVYVADAQAHEIRIFDTDGRHVRSFGRKGGGPGEFEQIAGMDWAPDGNLWVMDARNSRYAVFDTAGTFITSHLRPGGHIMIPWPGGFDREGNLYDMNVISTPPGEFRRGLIRYDREMEPRDTFALPEHEGQSFNITDAGGRRRVSASVPFSPGQSWTLTRAGDVWMGVSDRYRLHRVSFAGDTLQVLEKPFAPVAVSATERDEALEGLKWFIDQGGKVDASRIPATKPAFGRFFTDEAGYLWVSSTRAESENSGYDIFDPEGRYLGHVSSDLQIGYLRPMIRNGSMYAVVQDEMEVPYVVRLRIEGR